MAAPVPHRITAEEYLEAERKADFRSEFWLGQVYAMAGIVEQPAVVCSNLSRFLQNRLDGRPCRVFGSDMKVGTSRKRGFAYPDVTVTCGERRFYDDTRDVLMNPTAIFEVLSDSTRAFDLAGKFVEYQRLESLRHYILIEPKKLSVYCYERGNSGTWSYRALTHEQDILHLLDIDLPLTEIYHQVELDPEVE
jgi:Uma2 family endonuclease